MYVIVEPELGSKVRLKFYIEQRQVDRAYQKLYDQVSNRGDIPGFRKGKVPAWRVRRQFGGEVVDGAVFADVMEQALTSLLVYGEVQALEPADFGDEDEKQQAVAGKPLEVEAVTRVRPEARVPDYNGIEIEVPDTEPTEEQIEEKIRDLRDAAAEIVEVQDREVRAGDLVEAALKTKVEGEEEEGERNEAFIVGEDRYDPALDKHLLGHKTGETVEFTVDYPDKLTMGDLAGKTVQMAATINVISERHLPEVNEQFAAQAVEASSVEEFREKVVEQVRETNRELAERVLRNGVARWLADNVRVDLPDTIAQWATGEDTDDELGDEVDGTDAPQVVKLALACNTVLTDKGIAVGDEAVREEYVRAGESHGLDAEQLASDEIDREVAGLLLERAIRRKAIDTVSEAAIAKPVPLSEFLADDEETSSAGEETGEEGRQDVQEDGPQGSEAPTEEQANEQSD